MYSLTTTSSTVACPSCGARHKSPASAFGEGCRLSCARCGETWFSAPAAQHSMLSDAEEDALDAVFAAAQAAAARGAVLNAGGGLH